MQELPIILFGVGGVGSALLRQIVEQRSLHADEYGLRLNVCAVCDSSGAIIESGPGLDDDLLAEDHRGQSRGQAAGRRILPGDGKAT